MVEVDNSTELEGLQGPANPPPTSEAAAIKPQTICDLMVPTKMQKYLKIKNENSNEGLLEICQRAATKSTLFKIDSFQLVTSMPNSGRRQDR